VLDRYSAPVRSVDGDCYGRIWFFRDITERREAEAALRKSEQRFRSVVENASDLVTILDREGIILYQSPAIERTYGYAQDELIGLSCFEFVHPDDIPAVIPRLIDVVSHPGQVRSSEFRFRHKDGHWVHIEAVGTTLSPTGAEDGVIVNSRDITERKRTELRLQETTRFLENLIASSPGVIFRGSGETFATTYISPNAEVVLGYSAEQFLADPHLWVERTHPDDRALVGEKLAGAMEASERQLTYEYRFRHSDGGYRNLLASVRFEYDSSSGGMEVLGYTLDVSRLKEAEAALRAAKEEAEAAREVAERANRAKSEFLSRMSHELRTPMNSILGFAQILAKRDLPPDQAKGVDHIIRGGRHLLNLINEVLDLARIESNRDALSLEPVHAATLLSEAVSMMRPNAAQQDCHLDDRIPAEADRYVHADRQRLTQVVLNLLSNAIKFNRPGGSVSVVCDVAEEGPDRGRLAIGVRDTGEGIPPERRDELFLPFSRLEADRAGIEGTGLGLTLCRRLVEAMDGQIRVESAVGEGSTFWIELPLASSPLERLPRTESEGGPSAALARASAVQKATILYIEDNLANLSLVETIFDDRPAIHFLPALQGRLGIELAQQHSPHLILLDLHLPDIPGEEVLRQLRLAPATRNIPVVVISADATPRQIASLRRAGAVEYLTKPLDIDRFREVVDGLLAARTTLPESP
jgi:PAS domain S-box-containing protein